MRNVKTLQRWDYENQAYEPYEVPDDWNVKSYSRDMDEIVNCPHCGRKVNFGSCYTSREMYTPGGLGYAVCGECYDLEMIKEVEWRSTKRKSNNHE